MVGKPNTHKGYSMISRNASAAHSVLLRRPLATSESKICVQMSTNFCSANKFSDKEDFGIHFQKMDAKPFNACNLSADLLKYMTKRYSETEKAR